MKIKLLPQTKEGKRALGLIVLWPLLSIAGAMISRNLYPGVDAGNGIIDDLRVRPFLAITMLTGIASGATSFVFSIIAVFKKGERSMLSILTALLGFFLAILLLGEVFVQH